MQTTTAPAQASVPAMQASPGLPGLLYFLMILPWPVTEFVRRRVRARLLAG